MKGLLTIAREHPLSVMVSATAVLGFLGAAVVAVSVAGWPSLFSFDRPPIQRLGERAEIDVWGSTGRDSYVVGEPIDYKVRVQYRPDRIRPDLDLLERSISFLPLESLEVRSSERSIGEGINEFVLDFVLQGVDVLPGGTYPLEPIEVFYSKDAEGTQSGKVSSAQPQSSMSFVRPAINMASDYPADVSKIPLRSVKGAIGEQSEARRGVMAAVGAAILALGGFYIWRSVRRRRVAELSEPERLWQEFHQLKGETIDSRVFLLRGEKIFTRLLQLRTQVNPEAFWSGVDPAEPAPWMKATGAAREILSKIYWRNEPSGEEAGKIGEILDGMLAPLVDEERMKRENEPSAWMRLRRQPRLLAASGASAAVAVLMLALAAVPNFWVSPDIVRYNQAIRSAAAAPTGTRGQALPFAQAADQIEAQPLKAALLYNAATTRAKLGFAPVEFNEIEMLQAVFQDKEPIITFLDDQDSIDALLEAEIALGEAERELKEAVKINRHDEDIRKNLELVGKRYRAVSEAVEELFDQASALPPAQGGAIVDVLQMKMPEKFKQPDKGKDNSNYLVLEKF